MGATSTDNFCLRWNDFAENVSGAFKDLRAESDFFDVTLACSDSGAKTLQAHKVILSACSNFFKTTFRNAQKQVNPYIYLRGVSYSDLVSILDFIYNGEVNVAQEDLNSFLAVAEELQIKGLTNRENNSNDSNNQSSSKKTKRPAAPDTQTPVKKVRKSSPAPITSSGDDHKDVVNIKDDPEVMASASTSHQAVNPEVDADFGEEFDESYDGYYDEQGEEVGETGEATDGTKETGGNDPSHFALRFVRTKDGELTYQCGLCGYLPNSTNKSVGYAKSRVCMHIKNVHSEPTNVVCPRCAKKFKNKESLRVHRIKYCRDLNATGGGSD